MAHVTLGHGLQQAAESIGLVTVQIVAGDTRGLVRLATESTAVLGKRSSRRHEAAADREAVELMHMARIDPEARSRVFSSFSGAPASSSPVAWLRTHPRPERRIDAMRNRIDEVARIDYKNVRIDWDRRVVRLDALGSETAAPSTATDSGKGKTDGG